MGGMTTKSSYLLLIYFYTHWILLAMPGQDLCCTWVLESSASSDPTHLLLMSTPSSGASHAGREPFGMPLCRCTASQRICSSSIISAEVAGRSTHWGALQRALKWRSVIYTSDICFILPTSPLYSNYTSVMVEPTDVKTSFSFEAWAITK